MCLPFQTTPLFDQFTDTSQELVRLEWLGHVQVRTYLFAQFFVFRLPHRRDKNDGDMAVFLVEF